MLDVTADPFEALTDALLGAECEHEREDILSKLTDIEREDAAKCFAQLWGQALVEGALEQSTILAGVVIINANQEEIAMWGMLTQDCLAFITKLKEEKAAGASAKPFVVSSAAVN